MKVITENLKFINEYPNMAGELAKRLHIKKDEIPFVRKYYTSEKQEVDKQKRSVISYISTDAVDRDGEKLLPEGVDLENYKKNPVVMLGHDYKSLPVGKNIWIKKDDKGLVAKTVFAKSERGDEIYRACSEDIEGTGPLLKGWSVGFIPIEWEDIETKDKKEKPGRIYKKWELLEYSIVPIPSCPEALTLAVEKGLISDRLKKDLEIEVVKDREIMVTKEEMEFIDNREIEVVKDDENPFPIGHNEFGEVKIHGKEIITKPETTEQYHRIPVSTGHDGHRIRTITISASQGIKALYCGTCKKVITYLFDVKKWTMEEAKKWVSEHKEFNNIEIKELEYKERWNKSLSKVFDVAAVDAPIATFNYALYEKFLECKVKEIFLNSYSVPSPLLGTYLAGFKKILGDFKLKDTRCFTWDGYETPPVYEVIKLNSEKSDDFLISGVCFYDADNKPLIVKFNTGWSGINVSIVTSNKNKEWNKELLDKVHSWAYKNNYLRGEKFALSGEFLDEPGDNWDNLILDAKYKDSIIKSASFLEKKGKDLTGRGLLFIGPPGTGKTKTGRVLMNELDTTFIWVSSRDFRYIGPMRALSLSFSLARDLAPSILFLEDIDTWLRGEMEFVTDLVKTEMDGIKQNKGLITIMTSNYPEKLPDALLDRPGRFHHIINFELPKEKERKEMLKLWAGEIEEKLLDDIVEKTKGFSGAHLKELVEFAKMIAEEDETEIGKALLKSLDKLIEQRELIEEIRENKTDIKAIWGKVKWVDGDIEVRVDKEIEMKHIEKNINSQIKEIESIDYTSLELAIKGLTEQVAELKEGRVLSTKNRTLVKDTIEALTILKERLDELYAATEPHGREEEKTAEIEREKQFIVEKDGKKVSLDEKLAEAVGKILSGDNLKVLLNKSLDEAVDIKLKKKMGRVE